MTPFDLVLGLLAFGIIAGVLSLIGLFCAVRDFYRRGKDLLG